MRANIMVSNMRFVLEQHFRFHEVEVLLFELN